MNDITQNNVPLTGRPGLISRLGAVDAQSAIRIVNMSRYLDRIPRQRDALIRYLGGRNLREVGEVYGVSREQARVMIAQAMRRVIGEMRAPETGVRVLLGLSVRAQNCLRNDSLVTDEAVRDWVGRQGPRALLRFPNMGRKTYLEICDAFGFDTEGPELPAPKKEAAAKESSAPTTPPLTGLRGLAQRISVAEDGLEPF